ncbi:unnamed protein product [Sphenostylis stenocarpa]|uniref:Uncharacterized protein n=1 Tax=Sphenostylis stenocarpa TaxID=92480 RepID=A0AA86V780_9FABA|nr:unnamed protein product [Sphenostylis stenocarpa]
MCAKMIVYQQTLASKLFDWFETWRETVGHGNFGYKMGEADEEIEGEKGGKEKEKKN